MMASTKHRISNGLVAKHINVVLVHNSEMYQTYTSVEVKKNSQVGFKGRVPKYAYTIFDNYQMVWMHRALKG